MSRRNSDSLQKFTLPTGLATNSHELKTLQKQLLQNHYQQPRAPKDPYSSTALSSASSQRLPNPELQHARSLHHYDLQAQQSERQLKNNLSNDLFEQIRLKQVKKQLDKQQTLDQEQHLIKHTYRLDSLQKQKDKQFKHKYQAEAKEDLQLQYNRRMKINQISAQQKQFYRNRYSVPDIIRSNSLHQLPVTYGNPTKDYCQDVTRAINPNDPQLARNSSFKITRKQEDIPHLDFMFAGNDLRQNYSKQYSVYQDMHKSNLQQKLQLKQTLLDQIKLNEETRKYNRAKQFNTPYTKQQFQGRHHPINNPVDFRCAHDNKYVLGELKTLQP